MSLHSTDADPKSVVCAFFKQGVCTKGAKCKFSHDLAQERKAEKKNMYHDEREETMEDWDEDKLREVVEKKHGAAEKAMPKTDIVSDSRLPVLLLKLSLLLLTEQKEVNFGIVLNEWMNEILLLVMAQWELVWKLRAFWILSDRKMYLQGNIGVC